MSSTTETRTLVAEIVDNADERELWIVGREFERPPYFHAGKGGDTRLARALRVCIEGRITPNSDGSYTVEGSEKRQYRCAESCSCPHSQQSKSKWCYHMCAVALYVEWQRRLRGSAPVALGTLRAGTLPLPPVTVDERLALGTIHDNTALSTHHMPQEDCMPDDDAQYIAEPDDAPVTVLERPTPEPARVTAAVAAGQALLPSLDARTLEQSMQAWAEQRAVVKRFIQTQLVEGTDYYSLKIGQRETKPTLSKAGSEKFLGLFQLRASFTQDDATWTMLGKPEGTLCYVCTLHTRSGEIVSEGRGARRVAQDGDVNKAVKMAQKSATIDAVLRTGALSEAFTQDIGEPDEPEKPTEPVKAQAQAQAQPPYADGTSKEMRQRIWARVQQVAPEATTREAVTRVIMEKTGLALHPDHYAQILGQLTAREG